MAYGVTASTLLLAFGIPPAAASAAVHTAECVTTGISGLSHRAFGNIDRMIFLRLLLPGVLGAVSGSVLVSIAPGPIMKIVVASYLALMGCVVLGKAFRAIPPRAVSTHLAPLGFVGAFLDSSGGGGWGPIVTSTLLARGHDPRMTIGSVNAVEFFVALASSVTFFALIPEIDLRIVVGLAVGGGISAPLAAWLCKRVPLKSLMVTVGIIIILLSLTTLVRTLL
jgi:hypothetical protein